MTTHPTGRSVPDEPRAPRVSVVTPTFNHAGVLRETIESILAQTFGDLEHLVIDDGSSDDTRAVVAGYGERVTYLWHANVGEAASTNRGWALARGEYVAVVSADDPMLPQWLEEAVPFLDARPEVIVAYPDWRIIDAASRPVQHVRTYEYDIRSMVGWFHTLPGPGSLIRRSALRDLATLRDPRYRYVPDLESWLRLALRGPFARIPQELATWRQHAGSTTVTDRSLARAREMVGLADAFFDWPGVPPELLPLRRYALSRANWLAAWVLQASHPWESTTHLRRSWALAPDDPPGLPAGLARLPRPRRRAVWAVARHALRP